jgi:carbonic anhydrase/acetyltransferase-like protein (isoleucine patch superfamily)
MGSIILDGVTIGEDSIIGAGALVTERTIIPPGSLVLGMPGKVARQLKDEEVARILKSAKNYIEYSMDYKDRG